jgi:uncharacterized protein (DUF3820 family)
MSILSFGNYKGHEIENVPSDYLIWLLESDWFDKKYPELVEEVEAELQYRVDWSKHFYSKGKDS